MGKLVEPRGVGGMLDDALLQSTYCLREENPHRPWENIKIPHRRKAELEFNPYCPEVTALTLQIMGNFNVSTLITHKHLDERGGI